MSSILCDGVAGVGPSKEASIMYNSCFGDTIVRVSKKIPTIFQRM